MLLLQQDGVSDKYGRELTTFCREVIMNRRRVLIATLVLLSSLCFLSFAQESAYPIRPAETRKANRPEVPGVHGLVTSFKFYSTSSTSA